MKLSAGSEFVLNKIKENGGEAYVVGGAVRSFFLGLPADDFDVTCSLPPERVKEIFSSLGYTVIETGIKHGTVTARIDGENVEITSFRSDGNYSDNRHPEKVEFVRTIESDLKRRDFTVNAICFDGEKFVDLFDGRGDCERKLLKAIGCPEERFKEDSLRILRALRFASVLGFDIEKDTKAALFAQKRLVLNLSKERIVKELKGILTGDYAERVLIEYKDIIALILPETEPCFGFGQNHPYHAYDVYVHSVKTCVALPKYPLLRLAGLTHDVGKPKTFFTDEKGIAHFYGHEKYSAELCEQIADRLKLSGHDKKRYVAAVRWHHYPIIPREVKEINELSDKYILRALNKFGEQTVRDVLSLQKAEAFAMTEEIKERAEKLLLTEDRLNALLSEKRAFSVGDLKVNGFDAKKAGLTGAQIGEALNSLIKDVIDGKLKNERAELLAALEEKAIKM